MYHSFAQTGIAMQSYLWHVVPAQVHVSKPFPCDTVCTWSANCRSDLKNNAFNIKLFSTKFTDL